MPHRLTFSMGDVRPACTGDLTVEGVFHRPLDIARAARLISIMGIPIHDRETGVVSIDTTLTLTGEGSLTVNGPSVKRIERGLATALEIIIRSEECVGCGICVGRCVHGALFLSPRGVVDLRPDICVHCGECLGKCPVTGFRDDGDFDN